MITRVVDSRPPKTRLAVMAAVDALGSGGLVAMPTDTVYGLATRADRKEAVEALFSVKRRPDDNPLPILLPDGDALTRACRGVPDAARVLAARFWPGPLTLVVPKSDAVSDAVSAGRDTVGVRVPDHPVALAILAGCEFLVAVTSANLSEMRPARDIDDVRRDFSGAINMIVGDDPCPGGVPSTVIDVTGDSARVLRPGAISAAAIQQALAET